MATLAVSSIAAILDRKRGRRRGGNEGERRWVSRSARGDSAADIVDRVNGSEVLADFTSRRTRTCAGSGQMPSLLVISMPQRLSPSSWAALFESYAEVHDARFTAIYIIPGA